MRGGCSALALFRGGWEGAEAIQSAQACQAAGSGGRAVVGAPACTMESKGIIRAFVIYSLKLLLDCCRKKLENRLGMEKNAAGHRLKINKASTSCHLPAMPSPQCQPPTAGPLPACVHKCSRPAHLAVSHSVCSITCLQDFIGYFESARQHGEPRRLCAAAAGCPALLLVGWRSVETALHLKPCKVTQPHACTCCELAWVCNSALPSS